MFQRMYLTYKKNYMHVCRRERAKKIIKKNIRVFFVPNGTKSPKIAQNDDF